MLEERASRAMASVKKKFLYAIGGTNSKGKINSCEEYCIETNSWRAFPPLNEKKKWLSACVFQDSFIYVFGGCLDHNLTGSSLIECLSLIEPSNLTIINLLSGAEM